MSDISWVEKTADHSSSITANRFKWETHQSGDFTADVGFYPSICDKVETMSLIFFFLSSEYYSSFVWNSQNAWSNCSSRLPAQLSCMMAGRFCSKSNIKWKLRWHQQSSASEEGAGLGGHQVPWSSESDMIERFARILHSNNRLKKGPDETHWCLP